ncbi:glutathione S-transferase family protein [Rhizobium sp. PAMB 3182]
MTRLLYSLCGADETRPFSPHVWKTKMSLAHKGLAYREVPTPFTGIPHIEGGATKTVPLLVDNGTVVIDSFQIALYLDETYPETPSLFRGEGAKALSRFVEGYSQFVVHPAITKIAILDIHDMLAPKDQAYFRENREQRFSRTLEDVAAGREQEIASFSAKLEPMRHMLKFQPFLGGDSPLFADYILFGALQWLRIVSDAKVLPAGDPVTDWFEGCLDLYDGLGRSVDAA